MVKNNVSKTKADRKSLKEIVAAGRRKCAIATVKVKPGTGKFATNDRFELTASQTQSVFAPLAVLDKDKQYDIFAHVTGGGVQSRVDAIRLAVAKAVVILDAESRSVLRKNNLLTRDNRVKERKKPGLRRARRAPQWAKR